MSALIDPISDIEDELADIADDLDVAAKAVRSCEPGEGSNEGDSLMPMVMLLDKRANLLRELARALGRSRRHVVAEEVRQ